MLPVILILLLHGCVAASGERPTFSSRNFNNVLHWKPKIPGEQVLYSVEYWRYGDEDQKDKKYKPECQSITALSCDLTSETPPIPDVQYIAQVYANEQSHGQTMRFSPIAKTVFGPPIVSVTPTMSSLHVNVTLPSGPNGTNLAELFNNIKQPRTTEHGTYYKLYISEPKWAAQVHESTSNHFVIKLKNNNTEYCGYVVYGPHFQLGRPPSEKATFCVTLKDDAWMVYRWIVIAAVPVIVIIIISAVISTCYVRGWKKENMPKILLERIRSQENAVMRPPDVNLSICKATVFPQTDLTKAEVCPPSDRSIYATIQTTVQVPSESFEGYSPQDLPGPAMSWDSNSSCAPSESQETSNQSSEIYSAVGVHPLNEEDQGFQEPPSEYRKDMLLCLSLLGKPTSSEAPPSPDLDCQDSISEGTLLLPTFRDGNGQLSLFQESRSATDGTVMPLIPNWQELLSDLDDTREGRPVTLLPLNSVDDSELSDSDYGQSISPSQVAYNSHDSQTLQMNPTSQVGHVTFESGYKENWMPVSSHGITARGQW